MQKVKKACQKCLIKPLNKENKTAEELFEWLMRTTENCTILSVFIATVAFAAAYTVPGGPDQSTGIPILNCKPFFVVFILADVFSLTLALTSVACIGLKRTASKACEDICKRVPSICGKKSQPTSNAQSPQQTAASDTDV
ncbi:hypothetical protein AAG906_031167 [Vitis piasezkii]